jgi:hypothetical protein
MQVYTKVEVRRLEVDLGRLDFTGAAGANSMGENVS